MEPIIHIIIFFITLILSFAGAISGGVGLILRPILIFLGVPPVSVIGSMKVAMIIGKVPSVYLFHKHKKLDWRLVWYLVFPMFLGTFIAALMVVTLLQGSITLIMGIFLLAVGITLLLNKNIGLLERKSPFSKRKRHLIGFFGTVIIAFINTFTGGMGPIFASFYIMTYGKTYISASALTKAAHYIGAGIASIVFIISGVTDWQLVAALAISVLLGSYYGVKFGIKKGEKWIRYAVLVVVFASAIKMIFF
ncbi:MAG: sulfite exporter TauE/SafE family protein [Nanoarchaeota archaeon]